MEQRQNTEQQTQNESNSQQAEPHTRAENPNPRANENIKPSGFEQQSEKNIDRVGSEITDGEDA